MCDVKCSAEVQGGRVCCSLILSVWERSSRDLMRCCWVSLWGSTLMLLLLHTSCPTDSNRVLHLTSPLMLMLLLLLMLMLLLLLLLLLPPPPPPSSMHMAAAAVAIARATAAAARVLEGKQPSGTIHSFDPPPSTSTLPSPSSSPSSS